MVEGFVLPCVIEAGVLELKLVIAVDLEKVETLSDVFAMALVGADVVGVGLEGVVALEVAEVAVLGLVDVVALGVVQLVPVVRVVMRSLPEVVAVPLVEVLEEVALAVGVVVVLVPVEVLVGAAELVELAA